MKYKNSNKPKGVNGTLFLITLCVLIILFYIGYLYNSCSEKEINNTSTNQTYEDRTVYMNGGIGRVGDKLDSRDNQKFWVRVESIDGIDVYMIKDKRR